MTHEQLRIAADTVIGIESEITCEGDIDNLTVTRYLHIPKYRQEGLIHAFKVRYNQPKRIYIKGGSRYRHKSLYRKLSTRTKKGYGKGRIVIRTVRKSGPVSKNSIDNLTWLV